MLKLKVTLKGYDNMKLKKTKKASGSYKDNLMLRKTILLEELRRIFKEFTEGTGWNL